MSIAVSEPQVADTADASETDAADIAEARVTAEREAREAARFMLLNPPVPLVLRPGYAVLAAAAVGLMPVWSRWPLRLPYLPVTERTAVRGAGLALTSTIRWAMTPR